MNSLPYQPVYWGDIYSEMIGFDLAEQAAYIRLRSYYWMNGPLTNDFEELRAIVGCTKKQWSAIYSKVLKQFTLIEGNRLQHSKVEAELASASVKRTRAQKGGFARAESIRNNDLAHAGPAHARPAHAAISKTKTKEQTTSVHAQPEGFEEFWSTYGRVGSKKDAMAAYGAALKRSGVTPSVLLDGAKRYRNDLVQRDSLKWQKHAQGWLNGSMWENQNLLPLPKPDNRPAQTIAPHIPFPEAIF